MCGVALRILTIKGILQEDPLEEKVRCWLLVGA